ncbi:MAG: hypothetical protein QGG40_00205, partial [Myxococcota bacterium]|nr:hypothetical protein [Myxococcota bacterium]
MSLLALFTAVALATEQPPAVRLGEPALLFSLPAINEKVAMKTVSKPGVALSDFIGVEPSRPSRAVVLFFFEGQADANYLPGLNKV